MTAWSPGSITVSPRGMRKLPFRVIALMTTPSCNSSITSRIGRPARTLSVDLNLDYLGLIIFQQGDVLCLLITNEFDDFRGGRSARIHSNINAGVLEQVDVLAVVNNGDRPI